MPFHIARRRHARHRQRADVLGLRRRQVDRGGGLRALASRDAEIEAQDRRRSSTCSRSRSSRTATSTRWYHAHAAGQALDQPARLARALLRRPPDRGRGRLLPGHRQAQAARRDVPLRRPHRRPCSGRAPGRSAATAATRRSSWRWSSSTASPASALPRPRRLLHRRARPAAALFRCRGGGARRADPAQFRAKTYEYNQSHMPVREQNKVVGHAVRAMYLYTGMADLADEFGDDSLRARLRDAVGRPHHQADVRDRRPRPVRQQRGLHRRLRPAERDRLCRDLRRGRADLLGQPHARRRPGRALRRRDGAGALQRRALRPSLDGETFFYDNPLESRGGHHRWAWHRCPCCPPNSRASSPRSAATSTACRRRASPSISTAKHRRLTVGSTPRDPHPGDQPIPGPAASTITVDPRAGHLHPALRVPGWASAATLSVNGEPVDADGEHGARLSRPRRDWQDGDTVSSTCRCTSARIHAHPQVKADLGRVAVAPRPAGLLRRGGRQRAPVNAARSLPRGCESAATERQRRPRRHGRGRAAVPARDAGRIADGKLYRRRAARPRRPRRRPRALPPLGQPGAGRDAGLARRGQ